MIEESKLLNRQMLLSYLNRYLYKPGLGWHRYEERLVRTTDFLGRQVANFWLMVRYVRFAFSSPQD